MANVEETGKGHRTISVEPNIVPFIDLMSVLITFLLISAVWTQVSMIQLGSSVYGKNNSDSPVPPPKVDIAFRLDITPRGYRVNIGTNKYFFEKVEGDYDDDRLIDYLKTIKDSYPEKNDAMVTIIDSLPYGDLVRGMDALMIAGFSDLAVGNVGVE